MADPSIIDWRSGDAPDANVGSLSFNFHLNPAPRDNYKREPCVTHFLLPVNIIFYLLEERGPSEILCITYGKFFFYKHRVIFKIDPQFKA